MSIGLARLRAAKPRIRYGFKLGKSLLNGQIFRFARLQDSCQVDLYGHQWMESSTLIPQRGTEAVRADRLWNLQRASDSMHALLMPPGSIFSFCSRVGEPSLFRGYRAGPVFTNGQVSIGVGGGLCLIATNLFNTFLRAGCEVLERHCHSIDAYGEQRFAGLGLDAAVAYGYKDLVVRNSFAVPLQLRFAVLGDSGQVVSSLWGQMPSPVLVDVDTRVLEEIPPIDSSYLPGWIVETMRRTCLLGSANHLWDEDYHAISHYAPCLRS